MESTYVFLDFFLKRKSHSSGAYIRVEINRIALCIFQFSSITHQWDTDQSLFFLSLSNFQKIIFCPQILLEKYQPLALEISSDTWFQQSFISAIVSMLFRTDSNQITSEEHVQPIEKSVMKDALWCSHITKNGFLPRKPQLLWSNIYYSALHCNTYST